MPKKTSETETVETMNMELSTPGTAEDTAVSMTENENSEIALGSAEEIVEKPDETVSPTTETAEADIAPDDGVEAIDSIPSPTTETEEAANLPQAPEDRPENTAAEPVVQETPEPKPKRSRRSASKPEPESVIQVTR